METAHTVRAFIGTFRRLGGAGIYAVELDTAPLSFGAVELAADVIDPTYVALSRDGARLYSVGATDLETRDGLVYAFEITGTGQLREIGRIATGGAAACHVAMSNDGRILAAANYLGGNICAVRLDAAGAPAGEVQVLPHQGSSIHPQRQTRPHPHSVWFDPHGERAIACDLGTDELLQYGVSEGPGSLFSAPPVVVRAASGSGPRHLAFHPSGRFVYVVNELASSVTLLEYGVDSGLLGEGRTWSALPPAWSGENASAAIRGNQAGDRLYVSNRGHGSIAVFAIDAENGGLEAMAHIPSGGRVPRDFALTPVGAVMLVADQESGTVTALPIDQSTGLPEAPAATVSVPGAVSVAIGG